MLAESALRQFRALWRESTISSGLLTDELSNAMPSTASGVDQRVLPEVLSGPSEGAGTYSLLHELRGQARLARGVLAKYAPDVSPAVRGRLYAFEAYAEIWLADLFCSGIPLSTLDFDGDYTYQRPSTTEEVYAHAVALFDSALVLSADSVSVQTLARVGQGRAFLALGQYAKAETAVAGVQPNDTYLLRIAFRRNVGVDSSNRFAGVATVSDREGENGLPYRSNGDPRTASPSRTLPVGPNQTSTVFFPNKYAFPNDSNWVVIASGVEAQLIRAEAALHSGELGTWLSLLNALRTTGGYTRIDTTYADPTQTTIARIDTVWEAGSGGVAGLGQLQDPGNERERIRMHFAERAAWLFVSGQRQGDLRRLVRVYRWPSEEVYPVGVYAGGGSTGTYGPYINLPIPSQERRNLSFKGCLNRDE